jgi:hypothetical protein
VGTAAVKCCTATVLLLNYWASPQEISGEATHQQSQDGEIYIQLQNIW